MAAGKAVAARVGHPIPQRRTHSPPRRLDQRVEHRRPCHRHQQVAPAPQRRRQNATAASPTLPGNTPQNVPKSVKTATGRSPLPLPELVRSPEQLYYSQFGTITAPMQMVLHQIRHCPYTGITKQFYLESKAWELVTLCLHDILSQEQSSVSASSLKPADIERTYHARDILLQHFDRPPTLPELARQSQINDCALKQGFRQVFGTTVFGYLHNYRLDCARQLLDQCTKTVIGVAHAVGFASRSSFARAFRKKFGVNPGEYLRQR